MKTQVKNIQATSAPTRPVPESWTKAAGILKRHKKALDAHIKKVRKEWSRI